MHETVEELLHYLRLIYSHRRIGVISAFAVCLIGWAIVALLPNLYRVKATLQVERSSMLQPLLKGITVESDVASELAGMMRQTMLVPKTLEQIALEAGVVADPQDKVALEEFVGKMETDIDISSIMGKKGFYTVTYKYSDPVVAQRVVEVLINRFLDSIVAAIRADSENTRHVIDQQVAEYKAKVEAAGLRVKEFKKQHIDVLSEDGRPYYTRLIEAKSKYQEAMLELREAEHELDSMRDQPVSADSGTTTRIHGETVIHPEDTRLHEAERHLTELRRKYTEQHPDVIAARRSVEQIAEEHRTRPASRPQESASPHITSHETPPVNSAYQSWKSLMTRAEAKVAGLRSRTGEYKRRVDELEQGISIVPQLEAELANLNREFIIQEDSYQKLVERRESAAISDKVERASDLKINLIEPPVVPTRPIKPNRLLLNTLVLVLGIGAGIGLALAISLIDPAIYTRQDLRKLTNLPVLGSVSIDRSLVRSESRRAYILALGSLLSIFIILNLLYVIQFKPLTKLAGIMTASASSER